MAALSIEKRQYSSGMDTIRIGGFNEGELSELKSMEHHEAQDKLVDMLNNRNMGLGTVYACGKGIYSMWFDNEFAYMNVGTSCD